MCTHNENPDVKNDTYLLTPRCRVLLEQLTGLQLVKKFPAFHETRRFITALTTVRHLYLSWASPLQSTYPHPTSCRSILILSIHLRLFRPSVLLPSGFPTKTLYTPLSSTHTRHMPSPSHSSRFNMIHMYLLQVVFHPAAGEREREKTKGNAIHKKPQEHRINKTENKRYKTKNKYKKDIKRSLSTAIRK